MDPSPPGHTELSRLWLEQSLRGVQGIKWEGTSPSQWSPLGTGFSQRAARLPRSASCSQTSAKFRDSPHPPALPPSRTRSPGAGPAVRAAAAAAQALGCSRARERALWRGVGTEGNVAARSLAATLPPPPPGATPSPASPSLSTPQPPPESSGKACSGPPPWVRAHQIPFQTQSAEGGGLLGKGMAAAVSRRLQRGRGLQSRENGRGQGRADPAD